MLSAPLQCQRMAATAEEYCRLIDGFKADKRDVSWVARMVKLLPRLHVSVIALTMPACRLYHLPDDDERCELYMHLHYALTGETLLWTVSNDYCMALQHRLCDRLADDFTDMYFDLKGGLETMEFDPHLAMQDWACSFYLHWGRHLLDAEYWLNALSAGSRRHLLM